MNELLCDLCPLTLQLQDALKCQECHKQFRSKAGLNYHTMAEHSSKVHTCSHTHTRFFPKLIDLLICWSETIHFKSNPGGFVSSMTAEGSLLCVPFRRETLVWDWGWNVLIDFCCYAFWHTWSSDWYGCSESMHITFWCCVKSLSRGSSRYQHGPPSCISGMVLQLSLLNNSKLLSQKAS